MRKETKILLIGIGTVALVIIIIMALFLLESARFNRDQGICYANGYTELLDSRLGRTQQYCKRVVDGTEQIVPIDFFK